LSELGPSPGTPLTSLRQLGWPLDTPDALALVHDQLAGAVGGPVTITPLLVGDLFQSAAFLAAHVAELLEEGQGWGTIEQFFVKVGREGGRGGGVNTHSQGTTISEVTSIS
jgi:hypothetical protein